MKKIMFWGLLVFMAVSAALFAQNAAAVAVQNVPDGTYKGTYALANKSYTYDAIVQVEKGKLVSIKLVKAPNKSVETKAVNAFADMVKQNSVDAASGATWKAVVNDALTKQTPYKAN